MKGQCRYTGWCLSRRACD